MSSELSRARARFESTPRPVDDDDQMTRIVRGDRGCLGDALSGVGAVALVTFLVLSGMGKIAFGWVYVGVAIFVGGFFTGAVAQSRSGKQRRAALESGPMVRAVVLRAEPWLSRPGKRVGRAVVVFCTDEDRRFDRAWLEQMAKAWEEDGGGPGRELLRDPNSFGLHPIPDVEGARGSYVATVLVHPERLEGGYLGGDDDREADERDDDLDRPSRPATILVFVEPSVGFVEQVPRVPERPVLEPDEPGSSGQAAVERGD